MNYYQCKEKLYNNLFSGVYNNLPSFQFSKDELYIDYMFQRISKIEYDNKRSQIEFWQNINDNKVNKYII